MALVRDPRVDQILTGRPPVKRTTYRIPRPSSAPSVGSLIGKQGPGDWETVGDTWKDVVPAAAAAGIGIAQNVTDLLPGGGASPIGEAERYAQDYWAKRYSPEHQAELARQEKEKAAVGSWSEHPLDRAALLAKQTIRNPKTSIAEMVAQYAPVAGIGAGAKLAGLTGAAAAEATGAALGVGAVRTGIYDTTYEALRKSGVPETEARARAERAQSYTENPGLFATAAVAGKYVAKFGEDEALIGLVTPDKMVAAEGRKALEDAAKGASVRGLLTGFAREAATEAPEEFIQNVASNVGAQRAGADVSPWEGAGDAAIKAGLQAGPMGAAGHFGGGRQARAALAGLDATAVPSRAGEPGENPDILGDPVLDALVGRPGSPPGPPGPPAPPARFSEEEALAPLRSPEFTQSDLGVGVDSKSRLSPLRDEVSRLREERARRAQEIRPATPEEAAQAQRDAEDAFAEPIIDEAMATPPNPAADPTVQAIVREMDAQGAQPRNVVWALKNAGVPNPAAVVEEIRSALAPELYEGAKAHRSELEQAEASVRQRAAEENAYAKLMTALTGSGMTVSQARKVARPAAKEMSQEVIQPATDEKVDRGPLYDQQWQSDEGAKNGEVLRVVPLTGEAKTKTEQILSSMKEGDRILDLEGTVWEKRGRFFKTKEGEFVEAKSLDGINLLARSAILPVSEAPPVGGEALAPAERQISVDRSEQPAAAGKTLPVRPLPASSDVVVANRDETGDVHGESVPPSEAEVSAHFARVAARVREIKRSEPNLPHRVIAQRVNQEFGNDNRLGRGHEALTRRMVDEVLKGEENPKTSDKGNYPGGPVAAMVNSRKDTGLQNDPERALYEAMDRMDRQQGHIAESVAAREEKAAANMAEGERLGERLEESVRNPRGKRVQGQPAVVGADQGGFKEQNRAGVPAQVATDVRPGNREVDVRLENGQAGNSLVANEAPRVESFDATGTTEVPDSREVGRDRTTAEKAAQGPESVPPNAQVKKPGAGEFARDWLQKYAAADIEGRRALVKGLGGKLTYEDMRQLAAYTDDITTDNPSPAPKAVETHFRPAKLEGIERPSSKPSFQRKPAQTDLAETWKDRGEAASDRTYSIGAERGERSTKATSALTDTEKATLVKAAKQTGDDPNEAMAAAREIKARFPRSDGWGQLEVSGIEPGEGKIKGRIQFKNTPYSFQNPPGWNEGSGLNPNSPKATPWIKEMADRVTREIVALTERAAKGDKTAQAIMDHVTWYRQMARRLRDEFGGFGDAFADLLGATSPNTPVKTNWDFSIDLLRRFVRGDFDAELKAYEDAIAKGIGPTEFRKRFGSKLLKQISGAEYGMNSVNAAKALVGMWRAIQAGDAPKAKNFALNLIGQSDKATIDVWAARMLQRLAKRDRVPGPAEVGVTGSHLTDISKVGGQFGFGQKVLEQAASKLRDQGVNITAPDLQAVAWFLEKELWTKNGWTSAQGEGGSFEEQLDKLPVDRYQALATIQQTKPPTDKQMAIARERMTLPLRGDADVVAFRANPTMGMYAGSAERSFDQEVMAKAGWNPAKWIASLAKVAKAAKQMDIGITRVIRPNEDNANARPGLEIYFRTPQDLEKVRPILDKLVSNGVDGFTLAVDTLQRRATEGGQQAKEFIGVRMQYVPEMAMRFMDKESQQYKDLASGDPVRVKAVVDSMAEKIDGALAQLEDVPEVAYAEAYNYDTLVVGKENYDGYTDSRSGAADRAFGKDRTKEPLSSRLQEAARRLEGRPGLDEGAVLQPSPDGRTEASGVAREGQAAYAYLPDGTEYDHPDTAAEAQRDSERARVDLQQVQAPAGDLVGLAGRDLGSGTRLLSASVAIPEELKNRGWVDLRGQRVKTHKDLAVLARIYRDPRFETFRVFYTTKTGKIIAHEAMTSRMVGMVKPFQNPRKAIFEMNDRVERLKKAYGIKEVNYYLLHNHPSGTPTPSGEDVSLTAFYAKNVPGFKGHVVLDGDAYGLITSKPEMLPGSVRTYSQGQVYQKAIVPLQASDVEAGAFLGSDGKEINGPNDLANVWHDWRKQAPKDTVFIALTDSPGKTRALISAPTNLFKRPEEFSKWLRGQMLGFGGRSAFAVIPDGSLADLGVRYYREGLLTDFMQDGSYNTFVSSGTAGYVQREPMKDLKSIRVAEEKREAPKGGFYSALERAAEQMKQPMRGGDALRFLSGREGVKKAELEATGLWKMLTEKATEKVTPEEVREFLKANKVTVEKKTLGGKNVEAEAADRLRQKYELAQDAFVSFQRTARDGVKRAAIALRNHQKVDEMGFSKTQLEEAEEYNRLKAERDRLEKEVDEAYNAAKDAPRTKFSQYQTPGGTNYREVLLTLPPRDGTEMREAGKRLQEAERDQRAALDHLDNVRDTPAEKAAREKVAKANDAIHEAHLALQGLRNSFRSSHFEEPNILAHVRMNDRTVDGKKVLFIEEIQSDWAQKGRKEGFNQTKKPEVRVVERPHGWGVEVDGQLMQESVGANARATADAAAERIRQNPRVGGPVPSAPFVEKTEEWTALAMKSILQKAAAEGYDAVAWTTGSIQNERYDLSKQVSSIESDLDADTGKREVTIHMKTGMPSFHSLMVGPSGTIETGTSTDYAGKPLSDVVGKDMADRIMAEGSMRLEGPDLRIGGKGMTDFYDRIVPQVAEKLAKKWGAKVEETSIPTLNKADGKVVRMEDGSAEVRSPSGQFNTQTFTNVEQAKAWLERKLHPGAQVTVHSIELTPQMKQGINNEGFPLFARNPKEMTEEDWAWYNGLSDEERSAYWTAALKKEYQVKGARRGIVIADFEGDVPQSVIETMQNSPVSTALAKRVDDAVRMIARVAGYDVEFGGFTPAGNLHGVLFKGKLYLNYLATDQLAKIRAQKTGVSYEAAFGQELLEVILHEYAHKNEAGHGKAHDAEMERLFDLLGENGRVAIVRDGALFAAGKKNNAFIAQMTKESVPGWIEGENRGRQAAAKEQSGRGSRGGVPVESARGSGAEPGASQVGPGRTEGAGDRRSGGVQQVRGSQAGGLAGGPVVRSGDGRVAPQFARKPPAPPGQLLEEETNAQRLQRGLQDRLNRLTLGEVAVNARKGITATPSLANRIYGVSPRVENAVSVAEHSILNPILDGVKKNGLDFDLLGDYAKDDKDAAAKVVSSGKQALYDAARDQIKGVFDRSDAVRLATGIDDEETIAAAKKKRGPSGLKITKEHPLYEAVRELEGSILRAEHNRAMENLADFVEKNGVPEFGRVRQGEPTDGPNDGQNSILLKRNGETWSIDLADDKMAEAIKKLNTDQLDVMTRTVGAVTRWVSRINTLWSPTFTLKNKIRDVGNAVLSSMILNGAPNGISRSVAFKVAAGQVPAWKGTREYMRNPAGKFPEGSPAWWAQQAHKNAAVPGYFKSIESIDRIESRLGSALKASQRQNALRDFGAFLMGLAQAGEASTRVSVYRALVEEGMSPSKAGDVARGTLDVNKRGEWAKAIGAFSPFFNSSVQGTARLVEMVRSPDPAVRRRAQATMASLVTGGLLVGAALAAWGGDDDQDRVPDSDQVPEWDTQRNLVIPWLGGTRLRIPLPQGFSAPFYAGFMLGKTGRGNATAKQAAGNIGTAFYDQFAPISSPFGVAQPLADVARNQKFSGGPIRPIRYPGMLQPSSQMAFKSTSEAAKGVASGLNRLTGGDEAVPGLVDIAPGDLEYLAKAGTGGLGKFLSDAYTASESLVRGETPKRVPLISDFVTDANAGQRSRFYEQSRDVDQAESRLKLVEGEVRRGVLQAAVPGMDFSRTPLSDLREATAGVSFSPEQRARFRSQDRALMALKPMFDSAAKTVKAIDAMPNGPEKDAAFERIALKVNRAYQAAIRGGSQ